jgi:hypothetical protein
MDMAQFANNEPRVHATVFLRKVTVSNGAWLARTLPKMQQRSRPEPGAVRVQDIALRYRSGRVGIADALDAAAAVLTPLAAAGAELDRRNDWYICDEDEDDEDDDEDEERPTRLSDEPKEDLLVSCRLLVNAAADDVGAAALHWIALALAQ